MHSFIKVDTTSHFPIQNLPYGVFKIKGKNDLQRVGVAIGEYVLDLSVLEKEGYFKEILTSEEEVFSTTSLNRFMKKGHEVWHAVRKKLQNLLHEDEPTLRDNAELRERALIPQVDVEMQLPVKIGDYTTFMLRKNTRRMWVSCSEGKKMR